MAQEISDAALKLLSELTVIPQVVGYDHRLRELDEAQPRLITWIPREGYFVSEAGLELLASRLTPNSGA